MAYKTILVQCDAGGGTPVRLKIALDLASHADGHVVGLYVRQAFQAPGFIDAGPPMDSLYRAYETQANADEGMAAASFRDAVGQKGYSSEWRGSDRHVHQALTQQAPYAAPVVL